MSTVELNQVMELEKMVKDGDWQAVMQVATWYDDASASNAESSQEVDDDSMDHPIPREPPALLADSEPQVELPAVEPPAVDLEQRTEIELLLRHVMPDEVENMDEVLVQFSGREKELIATLTTMNEATLSAANERRSLSSSSGSGAHSRVLDERGHRRR